MLVVHGGPTTAVARGSSGESVVLLSGELPADLTDAGLAEVLHLAAAVLDGAEMLLFRRCLAALRRGDLDGTRSVRIGDAVLTVYAG